MIFNIIHQTKYNYEGGVTFCHNLATLKPRDFMGQALLEYRLEIDPEPVDLSEKVDFFGNTTTRFSLQKYHTELTVTAYSKVDRNSDLEKDYSTSKVLKELTLEEALLKLKIVTPENLEAKQFQLGSTLINVFSEEITNYALVSFKPDRPVFEAAYELMQRIFTDFEFNTTFSNVATPLNEVMKEKKGVCQDFAQIAIACVRAVGMPARYVSGYIETLPPPGKEKLVGTDASHAWFSVFIPDFGWVDFDPTNDQIPKNQHITVAYGRDYYDVPPLKGVIYSSGNNLMSVSVDIRPA